ncbi:MAG: 3-isopropylmalate dehydratase [Planctomycetes bacterium DG_23]|nr:MAG: 3-isopropylmalate dehydratase [Planctomycetes bacterium DG_23]
MVLKGRVWKFGDGVSTDDIIPGRFFHLRSNLPELAKHTLEDLRPQFVPEVKSGDFVVGGENFGQGSSREHAAQVLKSKGVNAVLAKSFARIFFRNAINVGLAAIICDTDEIDEGDELEINLEKGIITNLSKKRDLTFTPLPRVMACILSDGGLVAHIKKQGEFKLD